MRTDREVSVHDATAALERYEAFVSKQLTRTRWAYEREMMESHIGARADWLEARRKYLEQVLTAAVNRDDLSPL